MPQWQGPEHPPLLLPECSGAVTNSPGPLSGHLLSQEVGPPHSLSGTLPSSSNLHKAADQCTAFPRGNQRDFCIVTKKFLENIPGNHCSVLPLASGYRPGGAYSALRPRGHSVRWVLCLP
jgi:hypothetical protein